MYLADGERFVNLDTREPLPPGAPLVTANAYLGARPIADALAAGAQVVVTGRVTDASVIVGPALHAFGWPDDDFDSWASVTGQGPRFRSGEADWADADWIPCSDGRARLYKIAQPKSGGNRRMIVALVFFGS